MHYRAFGKDKRKVSVLGFGCMRLPTTSGKQDGTVDMQQATRMIRYGIDNGINYLDTAKVYHDGKIEAILGEILADGYRDKVSIATKLPIWDVKTRKDADRIFDEQRRDLRTEKIDVYLLHNIQRSFWGTCKDNMLAEWANEKKERGEIDYVGFSFHDDYDLFAEVVDSSNVWDFCQIQYNYVNETVQAGKRGLEYAVKKGLSVVVMEPLLGGCLAKPTGKMAEILEKNSDVNPVDLALRWLWSNKEISVVLSGMSSFEQVEQNIKITKSEHFETLSDDEQALIGKLQKAYDDSMPIKCTKCRYCMPCPGGVDIPLNFEMFNNHHAMTGLDEKAELNKILYSVMQTDSKASACIRCGQCLDSCPQKLAIPDLLEEVDRTFRI